MASGFHGGILFNRNLGMMRNPRMASAYPNAGHSIRHELLANLYHAALLMVMSVTLVTGIALLFLAWRLWPGKAAHAVMMPAQ
jgi:hypothetical protein